MALISRVYTKLPPLVPNLTNTLVMALVNPFLSHTKTCFPLHLPSPQSCIQNSSQLQLWTLSSLDHPFKLLSSSLLSRRKHARCGAMTDIKAETLVDEEDHKVLIGPSNEKERRGERVVADYDWEEEWYPLYLTQNVAEDAPFGLSFDKQLVLFKDAIDHFHCYEIVAP